MSKSSAVNQRIGKVIADEKRRELIVALERFWKSGLRLRVVGLGLIPLRWWAIKFDRTVEGVAQWSVESRGPKQPMLRGLRCTALKGRVQGILSLPKFALYMIKFCITKGRRIHGKRQEGDEGNPNDCVTVRVGTNLESMQLKGVFKNVSPPGFSVVEYHIKHDHLGKQFAFSFEFVNSSKGDLTKELVVTDGTIEEQKPPPIEDYIHPVTGERRTVSEYVHRVRLESAVPKIRAIGLLQELDRLKDIPDDQVVDSAVLHGGSQRFERKVRACVYACVPVWSVVYPTPDTHCTTCTRIVHAGPQRNDSSRTRERGRKEHEGVQAPAGAARALGEYTVQPTYEGGAPPEENDAG